MTRMLTASHSGESAACLGEYIGASGKKRGQTPTPGNTHAPSRGGLRPLSALEHEDYMLALLHFRGVR
jgi:hypothetical protein